MVTFEEIPDKVTLSVAISNCKGRCHGCHSPELRENIGTQLTTDEIDKLISANYGVNCFLFLGEGKDTEEIFKLATHIRDRYNDIDTAIYIGRELVDNAEKMKFGQHFNYVKTGAYMEEFGPLPSPTTNQRLYKVEGCTSPTYNDITYKFWKNAK